MKRGNDKEVIHLDLCSWIKLLKAPISFCHWQCKAWMIGNSAILVDYLNTKNLMCSQIWLSCEAEFHKCYQPRFRKRYQCGFLPASIAVMAIPVSPEKGKIHCTQQFFCQTDWRAGEALQGAEQLTFPLLSVSTAHSSFLPRTRVALLCLSFPHWHNSTEFSVSGDRQEIHFCAGKQKKISGKLKPIFQTFTYYLSKAKQHPISWKDSFSLIFTSVICVLCFKKTIILISLDFKCRRDFKQRRYIFI